MPTYSGAWPVMPTPYDDDMHIDAGAYRELIEWYIANHVGGVYANCLTSEMYALDAAERLLLVSEAVKASAGRVPVAATGNFGATLAEHVEFCKRVADAGADVVMLVVPEFVQDDGELEQYLFDIAEQVDAHLGLYECPVPRPYHLGVELVGRLAWSGRFYAFKETSCELDKICALAALTRGTSMAYLQANTPYLLEAIQAGSGGSMSIAAGFAPGLVAEVIELAAKNDPRAVPLHDRLCAMELAERVVHPVGMKYMLAKQGLPFSMRSRSARPLSGEVICALDAYSRFWFCSK